ncbi:hypothetical protein Tco_0075540, partial [Tanacetum coccineum]
KEQVKSEVSKITPQIEKLVNEQLKSEVLVRSSKEATTTHEVAANLSDLELEPSAGTDRGSKRRRSGKEPESTSALREKTTTTAGKTTTGVHDEQPEEEVHPLPDWFQQPKRLPSPDRAWNKSVPADHESVQPWLSNLSRRYDPRERNMKLLSFCDKPAKCYNTNT